MKKSKILIPAFAVLALSVGASVTGTVAWFTANRTVSFGSSFGVVDSEGALSIKLIGNDRTGTSISNTTVTVDGKLTHGSYDAKKGADGSLYVANMNEPDENGTAVIDSFADLGNIESTALKDNETGVNSKWQAGSNAAGKIWYGVSWKAEISIVVSSIDGDSFLFLDLNKTVATGTGKANDGFRIAIMEDIEGTDALVLRKDDHIKHVSGTGKNDTADFARTQKFGSEYTKVVDGTSQKTLKDDAGYIAKFDKTKADKENKTTIKLTFVAWYEGTDSAVTSGVNMEHITDLSANLSFYARRSNLA